MGAALRPGPAPGICGAPDAPRPASLRGGARLALSRCLPPRPLAQLCPNLLLLLSDFHPRPPLPARQFGSCAPPTCRTLQPREQPRAEALPDGRASAGRGAAQDEGGRAEGPGRRQTPLLGRTPQAATHAPALPGPESAGIFLWGHRAQRPCRPPPAPGAGWREIRRADRLLCPERPEGECQRLFCSGRPSASLRRQRR